MDQETNGALADLRVLELATNVAGPFGSTLFAEFGAEVIKIEVPGPGDPIRKYAPLYKEKSLTWTVLGRNKKSIPGSTLTWPFKWVSISSSTR